MSTTPERLRELLTKASNELAFCRVFVSSREKIAPIGLELYDALRTEIDAALTDSLERAPNA